MGKGSPFRHGVILVSADVLLREFLEQRTRRSLEVGRDHRHHLVYARTQRLAADVRRGSRTYSNDSQ